MKSGGTSKLNNKGVWRPSPDPLIDLDSTPGAIKNKKQRLTPRRPKVLPKAPIDQPEHNLDNESVVQLLVDCIREAANRRQVIIVTHNPNLAVVCDADQIVWTFIDIADGNRFSFTSGAIDNYEMNRNAFDVLEGSYRAFDNCQRKYHKPDVNARGAMSMPILR
jgi:hypothetical protein